MILSTISLLSEKEEKQAKLRWMNVRSDKRDEYEARIREIDGILKDIHHTAS